MRDEFLVYLHFVSCVWNVSEQSYLIADESIEGMLFVSHIPHILIVLGVDNSPVACTIKAQKKYSERQTKDVHHLKRCLKYKTQMRCGVRTNKITKATKIKRKLT